MSIGRKQRAAVVFIAGGFGFAFGSVVAWLASVMLDIEYAHALAGVALGMVCIAIADREMGDD